MAMLEHSDDYRALTHDDVADILCRNKNLLILFHVHPDGDAIGSAFALRAFVEHFGGRAWCVCADELPDRFGFVSDGIQESVKPESIPDGFEYDAVVSVDTASPSQLGALYDTYKDRIDVMIDHHGKGTYYADHCVDASASACGEVLYRILDTASKRLGEELPIAVCRLIYMAVSSDTGCFRYSNVSPDTHMLAASLISRGVDSADINHRLFGIKTLKQMQVEHAGFERMNFHCGGRVAVITFPYDLKTQYGAEDEALETLIDVARCVKGVEVAAVIKQPTSENRFRVSMRSSCDFDVSEVCALYGGGGHVRAAGCSIKAESLADAANMIIEKIKEII